MTSGYVTSASTFSSHLYGAEERDMLGLSASGTTLPEDTSPFHICALPAAPPPPHTHLHLCQARKLRPLVLVQLQCEFHAAGREVVPVLWTTGWRRRGEAGGREAASQFQSFMPPWTIGVQ